MRVLLATYGSRGDVEPIAALAVELQKIGADVAVCAPPDEDFAALVDRVEVSFLPFKKSWRSWATEASTADEKVISVDDFVSGYIDATYDTLVRAAQDRDILVVSGMLHFVAQSVAEKAAVPYRFVVFCPSVLEPQPWQDAVSEPINKHRASIGLSAIEDAREFLFSAKPWLAADPVLSPDPLPSSAEIERTPAWILSDERTLSPDLLNFLDAGAPPVYVGFGSMRMGSETARTAIEAIRKAGRRIVIGSGWADLNPIDGENDCFVVGEVNQQTLFRKVAAVIHHGGAGTTTTAARAGVPQVIIPQAADQPYWAARVAELGIGSALERPSPAAASLSAALESALHASTASRAAAIAREVRSDGAAVAANLIRQILQP